MARRKSEKRFLKDQQPFFLRKDFHQIKWFLLGLIITGIIASCGGPGISYSIEKQNAFKAKFWIGMSKSDVETILNGLEEVTFSEVQTLDNGEIMSVYWTDDELYGTNEYKFYFLSDLTLKEIVAVIIP
jgi:hypothetical protein